MRFSRMRRTTSSGNRCTKRFLIGSTRIASTAANFAVQSTKTSGSVAGSTCRRSHRWYKANSNNLRCCLETMRFHAFRSVERRGWAPKSPCSLLMINSSSRAKSLCRMWSTTSEKHLGSFSESMSKPTDNGGRSDADRTYSEGIICGASPKGRLDFRENYSSASVPRSSSSMTPHPTLDCSIAQPQAGRSPEIRVLASACFTLRGWIAGADIE